MNIVINKSIATVELKKALEHLIEEYHSYNKELEESTRTANQKYKQGFSENVYTDEYLLKALSEATEKASSCFYGEAEALNAKARQHIAAMKAKLIPALNEGERSSDYAVKVNNALQFIQLEGAEIDDSTAANILKEFLSDIDTMQRFRSVIEHQKGEKLSDAYGNTTFPLTFGRLTKCERFIEALEELEGTAEKLFIRGKAETETEYLKNGKKLSVPMDSYMQLMSEKNIIEQAEKAEAMTAELFTTTD